jgi:hypothetical protein
MMPAPSFPAESIVARIEELTARVEARLSQASSAPEGGQTKVPAPSYSAYEASAAVLAWFDPANLNPIGKAPSAEERDSEIDRLLTSAIRVTDASGVGRWALRPDRRVRILRELRERGQLDAALAANECPDSDPMQRALNRGLGGQSALISGQSLGELKASHEVALWLQAAGLPASPSATEIQSRIEWRTLLQPFEHVAGTHFRGRENELRRLRAFVGVVPPQSLFESATQLATSVVDRATRVFLGRPPRFAFVVYGPGGVGKSTLVARFILEHAEAHERDRFPFAYIDFDRPDVSPDEPLTLLAEGIRQLGIEYPEIRENCEHLRSTWLEQMAAITSEDSFRDVAMARIRARAIRDAASGLSRIARGDRPIVLVLDTFEEVQFVGDHAVNEVWKFLERLQAAIPPLRILIAGRSEIQGKRVDSLLLSGFDESSAIGYLEVKGVRDVDLARRIFRRFGGSPLTLKLAAELWSREGSLDEEFGVSIRDGLFRRLADENIQRQLYKRVLKHIHAPEIAKLAHPGLVLRRITPELILEVLAVPCDVEVRSLQEARALFESLKREVSLVKVDADGSLRHRQDLRLLMLRPLQEDEPERARLIHLAAVEFYAKGATDTERAEEIYHRLWLDQPLGEVELRWRRGVRRQLRSAVQEFDPLRRAFLAAKLGVTIDDEARLAARQEDWEQIVALEASNRLDDGEVAGALTLATERTSRTTGSPLILVESDALVRDGRADEAQRVLAAGIERASSDPKCKATAPFVLKFAEYAIRFRRSNDVRVAVEQLMRIEDGRSTGPERLQGLAQRLFLLELNSNVGSVATTEGELLTQLEKFSARSLARAQIAAQWVAAAPGENAQPRVTKVVRAVGVPLASEGARRTFAAALTTFDVAYSSATKRKPGAFARRCDVPLLESLTASWSKFVVESSPSRLKDVAAVALELSAAFDSAPLVAAVQQVMEEALGLRRPMESTIVSPDVESISTSRARLSASELKELVSAVIDTFNQDALRETVLARLGRNVYAYSSAKDYGQVVLDLVRAAEQEGWLLSLVNALNEARPDNDRFARIASSLGISGLAGDAAVEDSLQRLIATKSLEIDPDVWRNRLGQIERSVCRINMAGRSVGTGFLVGPDVVLTAGFTVGWPGDKSGTGEDLEFLFDYRTDASGQALTRGSVFGLSRQGTIAIGTAGNGDFALLRVDGSPGAQPIGGTTAESAAQLRKWIELPQVFALLSKGTPLAIAHHPRAGPLQISFGQVEAIHPLSYSLDTAPGSSGAPCFDARSLEPVALHMGRDPATQMSWGLELGAVLKFLENRKLDNWVRARFV